MESSLLGRNVTCAGAIASRARTASWSATTPTSRSCEAARHRRRRDARARRGPRGRARRGDELVRVDLPELDITDADARCSAMPSAERSAGRGHQLRGLDRCGRRRERREQAHAVNADGAGNLARAAAAPACALLQVSTDYVFDGSRRSATAPRRTSSPTRPGRAASTARASSRESSRCWPPRRGTRSPARHGCTASTGRNFVETMLRLAGEREAVQVVDRPGRLADGGASRAGAARAARARRQRAWCTSTGAGAVSWNGFAREIFRQAGVDCRGRAGEQRADGAPGAAPGLSALESERADVLPMPRLARRPRAAISRRGLG